MHIVSLNCLRLQTKREQVEIEIWLSNSFISANFIVEICLDYVMDLWNMYLELF